VVVGPGVDREISLDGSGLSGEVFHNVYFMPDLMRRADLAISSAGRTVTELLSCGVPVLCICQNEKELIHTHAAARFGVINLGLGSLTATETIAAHINRLVQSPDLRRILHERARYELAERTNSKIIARMMKKLGIQDGKRDI
jgi:spore coat polysaccharide biosynthesis predicted glycosyltransferase SpsG